MIFYFTATGNCLHIARQLHGHPISIPQEMQKDGDLTYKDDAIGIVYPIYGHEMPQMVQEFVGRATFDTPYFFLIPTYGCRHANAAELAQERLRNAGIEAAYISTLLMIDNWLPNFDMDEQRATEPQKEIGANLARIKADIAARKRWIEPVTQADRDAHEQFLSRGLEVKPSALTDFLCIDAARCIACSICARVCPAGCIAIDGGYASRDALGGAGCNACLACIHACPNDAIHLPMGEKNPHARFRNEHVALSEIAAANRTPGDRP